MVDSQINDIKNSKKVHYSWFRPTKKEHDADRKETLEANWRIDSKVAMKKERYENLDSDLEVPPGPAGWLYMESEYSYAIDASIKYAMDNPTARRAAGA